MSDDKSKLVPKIRFKGFTDAWKQCRLGEYGNFYYGKSAPKWSVSEDAPTPCVRYGELYTKFDEKIDKIYSHTNILPDQLKFSTGREVLVPRVGEEPLDFASCSWLSLPDVAIGEMISVYNTEQNPLFVAFYFNAMLKHEFAEKVEGGNVSNLYYDRLIDIPVKFPSTKEQKLVAWFFDTLNNTITFHKRKLNSLKELKKGYLQQMFPQAGEVTPRIRFTGFTGEWVERKLDGYIEDYIEKTIVQNQYPVLTSSQQHGIVFQEDYFANRQVTTEDNIGYFVLPKGYFTYRSRSDNNVFKFNRNDIIENGIISYFYPVFKIVNGNSDFFLQYLNSSIDKKVALEAEGTGQKVLSLKKFKNIDVIVPILAEQTAIGNFFRNLDEQIANQQTKLEKFKQLKAAYLQKMFV